jgi:hypothetical protein
VHRHKLQRRPAVIRAIPAHVPISPSVDHRSTSKVVDDLRLCLLNVITANPPEAQG